MPAAAVPTPPTPAPQGWTLEKRQVIGAAIGLVCIGILVGFKMAHGEPLVIEKPVIVKVNEPCPDCQEKASTRPTVQDAVPGDSSVPED